MRGWDEAEMPKARDQCEFEPKVEATATNLCLEVLYRHIAYISISRLKRQIASRYQ